MIIYASKPPNSLCIAREALSFNLKYSVVLSSMVLGVKGQTAKALIVGKAARS